ncbi:CaiB/BaiF CoA transferase family protein [Actinophytocola sp.]|uniref:CaiB/BaiF CoA transferase family protein n=1 Tax=Actinophytocola sp. TaxID=1872138 RepID=UPI003D6B72C7
MPRQPLEGVLVVDFGQIYAGAYASFLLAMSGATVVKVEPLGGEPLRNRDELATSGADLPFQMLNANKLGLSVNLKSAEGRDLIRTLIRSANVVVENFRPGVLEGLGLGTETLRADKPELVVASSSGYGKAGAYADLAAMDLTIQAMSGVMSSTGFPEHPPVKSGPALADFFGGIHLHSAVVTALYRQAVAGEGATIDVSMLEAVLPSLMSNIGLAISRPDAPPRTGNRHGGMASAPYNVYPTADGYLAVISVTDAHWSAILRLADPHRDVEAANFVTLSQRVARIDEVDKIISSWTSTVTTAQAHAQLRGRGIPCAPVRTLPEVLSDEYLRERRFVLDVELPQRGPVPMLRSPLHFVHEPATDFVPAPRLGEHNFPVLHDMLGMSRAEYERLVEAGVLN